MTKLGTGPVSDDIRNKLASSKGHIVGQTPGMKLKLMHLSHDVVNEELREPFVRDEQTGVVTGGGFYTLRLYSETRLLWVVEVEPCDGPSLEHHRQAMDMLRLHYSESGEDGLFIAEHMNSGMALHEENVAFLPGAIDDWATTTNYGMKSASSGGYRPEETDDNKGFYYIEQVWRGA